MSVFGYCDAVSWGYVDLRMSKLTLQQVFTFTSDCRASTGRR
jgi:hypothetical protein